MSSQDYLQKNKAYWAKGYVAENVESWVFRVYARIFKYELGIDGSHGENLLDFGCGGGGNAAFFASNGFNVHGVDISAVDIARCKERLAPFKDNFKLVDSQPDANARYFGDTSFKAVTAIQSLYYLSDTDMQACLECLHAQMDTGGVFFATMMGSKCTDFYNNSVPYKDGLRKVEFTRPRFEVKDYFLNFIEDETELKTKFSMFRPLHIGFYDDCFRQDEGNSFHYTFVGIKDD